MELLKSIRKLRIVALLLFVLPSIAIFGSLFFHNYLVSFSFSKDVNFNFSKNSPGGLIEVLCTEENNFCQKLDFKKFNHLDECYKNSVSQKYFDNFGNEIKVSKSLINSLKINNFEGEKLFYRAQLTNKLSKTCILNSSSFFSYKIFPLFFEKIYDLKYDKKVTLGTSTTVNPFIYGETSISNIAKRYPVNLIFKTLLYLGIACMIFYWIFYNKIFNILINKKKLNFFFIFGILSAIFLLLHVIFLGWIFENEFLTKLRRTYVIFFILFELLAQSFLIRKLFLIKDTIKDYVHLKVIYLKLYFVSIICSSTLLILIILFFKDLGSKTDYILEWNYFVILLVFYLLSFLMWKKLASDPSST